MKHNTPSPCIFQSKRIRSQFSILISEVRTDSSKMIPITAFLVIIVVLVFLQKATVYIDKMEGSILEWVPVIIACH